MVLLCFCLFFCIFFFFFFLGGKGKSTRVICYNIINRLFDINMHGEGGKSRFSFGRGHASSYRCHCSLFEHAYHVFKSLQLPEATSAILWWPWKIRPSIRVLWASLFVLVVNKFPFTTFSQLYSVLIAVFHMYWWGYFGALGNFRRHRRRRFEGRSASFSECCHLLRRRLLCVCVCVRERESHVCVYVIANGERVCVCVRAHVLVCVCLGAGMGAVLLILLLSFSSFYSYEIWGGGSRREVQGRCPCRVYLHSGHRSVVWPDVTRDWEGWEGHYHNSTRTCTPTHLLSTYCPESSRLATGQRHSLSTPPRPTPPLLSLWVLDFRCLVLTNLQGRHVLGSCWKGEGV